MTSSSIAPRGWTVARGLQEMKAEAKSPGASSSDLDETPDLAEHRKLTGSSGEWVGIGSRGMERILNVWAVRKRGISYLFGYFGCCSEGS